MMEGEKNFCSLNFVRRLKSIAIQAACLALICGPALTYAEYPDRPIRMIVGFTPGSGGDTMARMVGAKLAERWGQTFIVENRSGASNTIAAGLAARAAPDGYTLLMVNANHTVTPSQMKLSYDPIRSFAPVSMLVTQPDVLVVARSVPVRTLRELLVYAKSRPGALRFGSSGIGGAPYLAMALLVQRTGLNMISVNYRGSAESLIGLLGGEIQLMFASMSDVVPHVKEGKINALAVSTKNRVQAMAEVPTVAEAADLAGYDVSAWQGVLAPAATPRTIVQKLRDEMVAVLKLPEIQDTLARRGNVLVASTPEEFGEFIRTDIPRWAPFVKSFDR